MSLKKMKKEELELLSNKDITYLILEGRKRSMSTADLFQKIIELLELPQKTFESKIADYYTALSTDKRFILLEDGTWDLRNKHTSDKVVKIAEEEEEEDLEEIKEEEPLEEDSYDDTDESDYEADTDTDEDLKDLVVIDEDELELEE